jgi:hypothetical protein
MVQRSDGLSFAVRLDREPPADVAWSESNGALEVE